MPVLHSGAVTIPAGPVSLQGDLDLPQSTAPIVLFAHGSGSSRRSPRNLHVAERLHDAGLGTLLFDLLSEEEGQEDERTSHYRFDIDLLARRLLAATDWLFARSTSERTALGYFGASTGAAAAIRAAAFRPEVIGAVVSRGGRPDLAGNALARLEAPTLLIVGEKDDIVRRLNEDAAATIHAPCRTEIVPGARHLFEEPGALDLVADLAADWFAEHLASR
jgi:putative phosphoribosyl transferase